MQKNSGNYNFFFKSNLKWALGALRDHKVSFAVQQWISALLDQRKVGVQVGSIYIRVKTQCGLPTPWSLVADSLLKRLSTRGVFVQGFADGGTILIIGKVVSTLSEIMQRMLHGVEKWFTDNCLLILVKHSA